MRSDNLALDKPPHDEIGTPREDLEYCPDHDVLHRESSPCYPCLRERGEEP